MQSHMIACLVICCSLFSVTQSVIQYKVRGPTGPGPSRLNHNHYTKSNQHHTHPVPSLSLSHYTKSKWPMPPRPPIRPHPTHSNSHSKVRPIPVHMASYKVPVVARPPKMPPKQAAPLIFPSAVWKTPTAVYKPPVEKPFLISPQFAQHQHLTFTKPQPFEFKTQHQPFDFNTQQQPFEFQLNKEPIANIPTIKQIGEKGPIHTIPAPNLSPADKPNVILEEPSQKHTFQYTKEPEFSPNAISPIPQASALLGNALLGAQALPLIQQQGYQVTENAEPIDQLANQHNHNPFTAQKTYYAPDPDQSNLLQRLKEYTDPSIKLFSSEILPAPQPMPSIANAQTISSQELYQLLNGIPQQQNQPQQQLVDSYGMPIMQQQYVQQQQSQPQEQASMPVQNYHALLNSQQLFHPEPAYLNQIPDTVSQQIKDNFKPQFHTFNYEEQSSQNAPRHEFAQSRVTADYSVEPEVSEPHSKISVQSPSEALAQTQYIQQYFQTREDNNVANNELATDHDSSTKASQILSQLSAKNEISPSMFYSRLPNKEAAETLATLQAAGSINSNILKLQQNNPEENSASNHREAMRIFVPDEEIYEDMETQASGEKAEISKTDNSHSQGIRIYETTNLNQNQNQNSRSSESAEYEDYSGEENSSSVEKETDSHFFGNKIKPQSTR